MKAALFLTTELQHAVELTRRVEGQYPDARLVVFVRDEHREELAQEFPEVEVRRDKPTGSKVSFVGDLRRERFDLLVVAWHGGERPEPLRLVAVLAGARKLLAVDEDGREFRVAWYLPWTWAGHAVRRLVGLDAGTVLRGLASCYRMTLGVVLAALRLAVFRLLGPRLPGR